MALTPASRQRSLSGLRLRRPAPEYLRSRASELLASDSETDPSELFLLIAEDPLTAAWILMRANDDYYGFRGRVDSLQKAVNVLGGDSVLGMIAETGSSITEVLQSPGGVDLFHTRRALARHAVATALVAARLAREELLSAGPVFTAGLLHDIGKHVVFQNYPLESSSVYSESSLWDQITGADLPSVEQLAFGASHGEIGEYLARKMHFPDSLIQVAGNSYAPDPASHDPKEFPLLWICHAASLFVSATGYAAGKGVSKDICIHNPVWEVLISEHVLSSSTIGELFLDLDAFLETVAQVAAGVSLDRYSRQAESDKSPLPRGQFRTTGGSVVENTQKKL